MIETIILALFIFATGSVVAWSIHDRTGKKDREVRALPPSPPTPPTPVETKSLKALEEEVFAKADMIQQMAHDSGVYRMDDLTDEKPVTDTQTMKCISEKVEKIKRLADRK
jgi:hypothetical protein